MIGRRLCKLLVQLTCSKQSQQEQVAQDFGDFTTSLHNFSVSVFDYALHI